MSVQICIGAAAMFAALSIGALAQALQPEVWSLTQCRAAWRCCWLLISSLCLAASVALVATAAVLS